MLDALKTYVDKLESARAELEKAGPVHARDLRRQMHRMEKEIMAYKMFQMQARKGGKNADIQS